MFEPAPILSQLDIFEKSSLLIKKKKVFKIYFATKVIVIDTKIVILLK